jgi:hypothetical protein
MLVLISMPLRIANLHPRGKPEHVKLPEGAQIRQSKRLRGQMPGFEHLEDQDKMSGPVEIATNGEK